MSTALHLTLEEFGRMIERGAFDHLQRKIELIRGELREKNSAGPFHDDLIDYLTNWSVRSTSSKLIRVSVQSGLDLVDQESRPEPDLKWIRAARYRRRHANAGDTLLAIEVSRSSLQWDLTEKAALYAEAGIPEYWVVDAEAECVHVLRSPVAGQFSDRMVFQRGQSISPLACPDAVLILNDLFAAE